MGKVTGFMEYTRAVPERRPVAERVNDYLEVYKPYNEELAEYLDLDLDWNAGAG